MAVVMNDHSEFVDTSDPPMLKLRHTPMEPFDDEWDAEPAPFGICGWCGSEFEPSRPFGKYCCDACRADAKRDFRKKRYEKEKRERKKRESARDGSQE